MSHPPAHRYNTAMDYSNVNTQQMNTYSDMNGGGGGGVSSSSSLGGNNNSITSSDSSSNPTVKLSKIISCQIQGTMNAFNVMGPNAATWKPVDGKQVTMFGMEDTIGMSSATNDFNVMDGNSSMMLNADLAAATNSLRNVTITKATLLQSYNTFGVPLGVSINCLPRNEVVDTGDKYTFTTIPNTAVNTPSLLYEAGETQSQAMDWRKTYGKFNAGNLNTEDVLKIPNQTFVFVKEDHPVINLLRLNKAIVGIDIDEQPRMENNWIKVQQSLFDSSCDTLRTRILSKISSQDLTQLQVQLHRIGNVEWSHINSADALMSFIPDPSWDQQTLSANLKAHEQSFVDKPCTFMARIQLEYEMQR